MIRERPSQDERARTGPAEQTVLKTKFSVPRGPTTMVSRGRLLDALDAGVQGPLTLLAAPAGAGKSALLSSWVAAGRAPGPVAWLSLEGDDADRRRFWRAVLGTLSHATGDARLTALAVSPREPMDMDLVLPALVDALDARDEPLVLVLDDLHLVADVVREDIERLVRYPPPALRLVLVTRADPPIGLGRLRLEGWLTEIRARDLAFTLDEAAALFDALDVPIAPAEVATLWRRTEGWSAALCLAAMSVRAHPEPSRFIEHFAGTDATVSDYLLSEVLARQPPDLREFLLRTSIVDMVCGELADALTGGSDGQRMLARLEHGGALLAALDEHGAWYRYHPLFAELLRAELRAQLGGELEELHRRAAVWLAAHGDRTAALRHVAIGERVGSGHAARHRPLGRLHDQRRDGCAAAGSRGHAARARRCLPRAVAGLRGRDARLRQAASWPSPICAAPRARWSRCRRSAGRSSPPRRPRWGSTRDASAGTRRPRSRPRGNGSGVGPVLEGHDVAPNLRGLLLTQLGIVEMWTGDLDAAVEHLERAHAVAAEAGVEWTAFASSAHLALASVLRGDFARSLRRANQALAIAERRGWSRSEPAAVAACVLAAVCIQRDQLRRGRTPHRARRARRCETHASGRSLAVHALNRVQLLSDRGEHAGALDLLHATREQLGDWPLPRRWATSC